MTKAHIHELKSRLYNVAKTGSMDYHIDEIRNHAHRLEAVGHHVDDDDLVFYTLNGLPVEEFRNLKTAVRTRGDVSFEELTTILHSEEVQIHKQEASNSSKILVATTKSGTSTTNHDTTGPIFYSNLGHPPQLQMFQPPTGQGSYYPQNTQSQNRNSGYDNRGRGRNIGYGQKNSCQICGKTNHTAFSCYQRQNLNFQPPSFVNTGSGRNNSQPWNGVNQNGYGGFQNGYGGFSGFDSTASGFANTQPGFYGMTSH